MGINGLLPVLKPIARAVHVSKYSGKRVAVDGYSWLHKAVYSCSLELCMGQFTAQHVQYCVARVDMLRKHGVEPLLVFDGARLPSKADEEDSRQRSRKENMDRGLALLQAGNRIGAEQCFQKAVDVTPSMTKMVIEEMKGHHVKCVVAPYEADAQMAYLALRGDVFAVLTEDSDLLTYGCPRILFKLDRDGNGDEVMLCDLKDNTGTSFVGWDHAMFQEMCVMAGCDFLDNIQGIGIKKSHALIKQWKSFPKAIKNLRFGAKFTVPPGYEEKFQRALWVFRHQRVYCETARACVHLTPLPQGGLGAANVDVPSALRMRMPSAAGEEPEEDLDFLGPLLEPHVARGIAEGELDPFTLQPFDLAAIYKGCWNPPPSVRRVLNRNSQAPASGASNASAAVVGDRLVGMSATASGAVATSGQQGYTTLHQLRQFGSAHQPGHGSGRGGSSSGHVARRHSAPHGGAPHAAMQGHASPGHHAHGHSGPQSGAASQGPQQLSGHGHAGQPGDTIASQGQEQTGQAMHAHGGPHSAPEHSRPQQQQHQAGVHTTARPVATQRGLPVRRRGGLQPAQLAPGRGSIPHLFAAAHERSQRTLSAQFVPPGRTQAMPAATLGRTSSGPAISQQPPGSGSDTGGQEQAPSQSPISPSAAAHRPNKVMRLHAHHLAGGRVNAAICAPSSAGHVIGTGNTNTGNGTLRDVSNFHMFTYGPASRNKLISPKAMAATSAGADSLLPEAHNDANQGHNGAEGLGGHSAGRGARRMLYGQSPGNQADLLAGPCIDQNESLAGATWQRPAAQLQLDGSQGDGLPPLLGRALSLLGSDSQPQLQQGVQLRLDACEQQHQPLPAPDRAQVDWMGTDDLRIGSQDEGGIVLGHPTGAALHTGQGHRQATPAMLLFGEFALSPAANHVALPGPASGAAVSEPSQLDLSLPLSAVQIDSQARADSGPAAAGSADDGLVAGTQQGSEEGAEAGTQRGEGEAGPDSGFHSLRHVQHYAELAVAALDTVELQGQQAQQGQHAQQAQQGQPRPAARSTQQGEAAEPGSVMRPLSRFAYAPHQAVPAQGPGNSGLPQPAGMPAGSGLLEPQPSSEEEAAGILRSAGHQPMQLPLSGGDSDGPLPAHGNNRLQQLQQHAIDVSDDDDALDTVPTVDHPLNGRGYRTSQGLNTHMEQFPLSDDENIPPVGPDANKPLSGWVGHRVNPWRQAQPPSDGEGDSDGVPSVAHPLGEWRQVVRKAGSAVPAWAAAKPGQQLKANVSGLRKPAPRPSVSGPPSDGTAPGALDARWPALPARPMGLQKPVKLAGLQKPQKQGGGSRQAKLTVPTQGAGGLHVPGAVVANLSRFALKRPRA